MAIFIKIPFLSMWLANLAPMKPALLPIWIKIVSAIVYVALLTDRIIDTIVNKLRNKNRRKPDEEFEHLEQVKGVDRLKLSEELFYYE